VGLDSVHLDRVCIAGYAKIWDVELIDRADLWVRGLSDDEMCERVPDGRSLGGVGIFYRRKATRSSRVNLGSRPNSKVKPRCEFAMRLQRAPYRLWEKNNQMSPLQFSLLDEDTRNFEYRLIG
jgi:hypothetical protein